MKKAKPDTRSKPPEWRVRALTLVFHEACPKLPIGCVTPMAVVLSLPSPLYDHASGEVSNSPLLFTRNIRASMPGIPQMAQERTTMEHRVAVSKCW